MLQEIFRPNAPRADRIGLAGNRPLQQPPVPAVQPISRALVSALIAQAGESGRRRINHNFHRSLEENPNRFLNVMLKDAYFTPHRHISPPKPEAFLVLEGSVLCVIFDDDGGIREVHKMGEGENYGVDVGAGIWHTILVLSDTAVCYEVKPGPYVQASDKEFAPWAPREGDPQANAYAAALKEKALAAVNRKKY